SRVESINLLYDTLQNIDHNIVHFITASGVGVYPNSKTKLYTEEDNEIDDTFLAEVVVAWETAAAKFKNSGMEVSKVRTGVVLVQVHGALPQVINPSTVGAAATLGSADQYQSLIHIPDILRTHLFHLKNQLEGNYNAAAPNPVQNKKSTKMIPSNLHN